MHLPRWHKPISIYGTCRWHVYVPDHNNSRQFRGVDVLSCSRDVDTCTSLIYSTRGVRDRGGIDDDADDVSAAMECLVVCCCRFGCRWFRPVISGNDDVTHAPVALFYALCRRWFRAVVGAGVVT